jgi:Rod binding domain-containing protein
MSANPVAPGNAGLSGLHNFSGGQKFGAEGATPNRRLPQINREQVPKELRDAAEGMEAMFLDYLMKTMRQTVPKSEMDLENPATEIYRSMQDGETAKMAARSGGVGLADQIIAYMMAERYDLERTSGAKSMQGTGGTHEGR